MNPLADRLDQAARSQRELAFPDHNDATTGLDELWDAALRRAPAVRRTCGGTLAAVLDNRLASVELLLTCVVADITLVSLPLPHRAQSFDDYAHWTEDQRRAVGAGVVALPAEFVPLGEAVGLDRVASIDDILAGRVTVESEEHPGFDLVQFTSGTTGSAKPIPLSWANVVANIDAILDWIEPASRGECLVSWLPLSHDMGLVGSLLTGLVAPVRGGRLVLLDPQAFVRRPAVWMEACSAHAATITLGPDFGYRMAATACRGPLDLASLRICIAGSEQTRLSTFGLLNDRLTPFGWDPDTYCPAYGFAEAGLAVAGRPRSQPLLAIDAETEVATAAELLARDVGPGGLLSSGVPLSGFRLDAGVVDDPRPIRVAGPSMATAYLDETPIVDPSGWHTTGDLGVMASSEIFIPGRHDDIVVVGGENLSAASIEEAAASALGVRLGSVVALTEEDGLHLMVEGMDALDRDDRANLREAVRNIAGVTPSGIRLVAKGVIPRTPSGKLRRGVLGRMTGEGDRR